MSCVLRGSGFNRLSSLDCPPPVVRYEHKHSGDLVRFDIKLLVRIREPGCRVTGDRRKVPHGVGYEYLYMAVNDYSRITLPPSCPTRAAISGAERYPADQPSSAPKLTRGLIPRQVFDKYKVYIG